MRSRALPVCIPFVLTSTLFLGACSSTGGASSKGADAPSAVSRTDEPIEASGAVVSVRGLSCPKCATGVEQQLGKVAGVRKVHVDLSSGEIGVDFDVYPKPTRAQLAKAVEDSGFTLVAITPR